MAKIILFKDRNFGGEALVVKEPISNLKDAGWNDVVSSLIVVEGKWRIYKDANYDGNSWSVVPDGGPDKDGCYTYWKDWGGGNDEISSLKTE